MSRTQDEITQNSNLMPLKKRGRPPKNNNIIIIENNVITKEIKVKKNIEIIKNPKPKKLKIKSNTIDKKSMEDSIKDDEVNLWGLNQIDSLLLEPYEKKYTKDKLSKINNTITNINTKTTDKKYNPNSKYLLCDLDFLKKEKERIENDINQMKVYDNEYEKLLDLEEKIGDTIDDLELEDKKSKESEKLQTELMSENENNKEKKIRKTIPKPYFWIGKIPEGYREATQEEAITNKKVSLFGKYKVSIEKYNIFDITGSLRDNNLGKKELELKIFALKGKLRFYKKEYEYNKISLNTGKLSSELQILTKEKLENATECYKKTVDVLNFYLECYKNSTNNQAGNDKKIIIHKSIIETDKKTEKVESENKDKIIKEKISKDNEKKNKSIKN